MLRRKPRPGVPDVCVVEATWAVLPGFITTGPYWSSREGNSCNVSFCFTAQQWLDSPPHILCCCNSSRVANGFCDFVLCLHQWLLFASLLLLRAINTTLCSFGQTTACLLLSYAILESLALALFLTTPLVCVLLVPSWSPVGVLWYLGDGSRWNGGTAKGTAAQPGSAARPPRLSAHNVKRSCRPGWEGNTH